jgi:hypothetical protein
MPAIHAGMTATLFPCFVGERKIMKHFVVKMSVSILVAAKPRCALYTLRFV